MEQLGALLPLKVTMESEPVREIGKTVPETEVAPQKVEMEQPTSMETPYGEETFDEVASLIEAKEDNVLEDGRQSDAMPTWY